MPPPNLARGQQLRRAYAIEARKLGGEVHLIISTGRMEFLVSIPDPTIEKLAEGGEFLHTPIPQPYHVRPQDFHHLLERGMVKAGWFDAPV